jgi:hypothetical protein
MNFIQLSQLPAWLEGGFSKDLRENRLDGEPEEDCLIIHPLKLDLVFVDLHDLLHLLTFQMPIYILIIPPKAELLIYKRYFIGYKVTVT